MPASLNARPGPVAAAQASHAGEPDSIVRLPLASQDLDCPAVDVQDEGASLRVGGPDNPSVRYQFEPRASLHRFGQPKDLQLISTSAAMDSILDRLRRDFPPSVHPMVYAQAETGRKVLNVSPAYAVGIEEMENAEGDALLEEVFAHCLGSPSAYSHVWRNGDMVAWDNWRILHNAEGTPVERTRLVQRISIAGDYGLGRLAG